MIIYPKKIGLKDGTPVIIRPADSDDIEGLMEFFSRIPKKDLLIFKDDVTKRENIQSWFPCSKYKKCLQLIALRDDEIVSKGMLHQEGLYWQDAAELKLIVAPDYRGRGLGSQMFKILLTEGLTLNLRKIITRFAPNNKSFIRVLEHYGFKPETVLRSYSNGGNNGGYQDLMIASFNLEDWEGRFEVYSQIYGTK
ncbi:MAG TPA: GNAT family N-acetyltransferase [Thermodesulfobacteriota bacterium]|nr:GNAT family N-acetyltransferase [Thermodesulfobacteriota bacterium]